MATLARSRQSDNALSLYDMLGQAALTADMKALSCRVRRYDRDDRCERRRRAAPVYAAVLSVSALHPR
jgi:hypothetical protein